VRLLETTGAEGGTAITPESIACLATALRQALHSEDPGFRKAYLRLFIDQVIVGDREIRLRGPKAALAKATTPGSLPPVLFGSGVPCAMKLGTGNSW
jgi:hypothetical protein